MAIFEQFKNHRFNRSAAATLDMANAIIEEFTADGYTLTLRQLYYQFVGGGHIENSEKEYKRLGRIVTNAREAGRMDWNAIEDRGRGTYGPNPQESVSAILDGIDLLIDFDYWARQDHYVEVWVEKQALESVVERGCDEVRVNYMACKGYLSASEAWRAGRRFRRAVQMGKTPILIHLADHDPSGLDMTNDNSKRINLFAKRGVAIRRIALNMDQVEQYKPPPNPAKITDSRFKAYQHEFGDESWELDALKPGVIENLIKDTVEEYIDWEVWRETEREENETRKPLAALSDNWVQVRQYLSDEGLI